MFIYILELQDNKYYVGITNEIKLRLWTHFKMGKKTGSAWTKKYPPQKVIHFSEFFPKSRKESEDVECQCVLKVAKAVGFENVRGAGFSLSSEDYPESWNQKLDDIQPADFSKMKPLSKKELRELIKGQYEVWLKSRTLRRKPKKE